MKIKTLMCLLLLAITTQAQKINMITYFKNDTLSLALNFITPVVKNGKPIPLVLYVHGGGFSGGSRDSGDSLCINLAKNGYAAATISYTLYAKNHRYSCDGIVSEKIQAFQYAVNDLWLATSFFITNKDKYDIDVNKIFIAGSSAGAETVLHAAYWDMSMMNLYPQNIIPKTFKYAGIIGGSGAIMDLNLITTENKIPTMMFHGSADPVVPYATAAHHSCPTNASGWLMLFGSHAVYDHLISLNGTVRLFTFCGGGHEYSGAYFYKQYEPVLEFLNDVMANKRFQDHTIIATGKPNSKTVLQGFCN